MTDPEKSFTTPCAVSDPLKKFSGSNAGACAAWSSTDAVLQPNNRVARLAANSVRNRFSKR
jgi:hypothetical protein